MKIVTNGDSHIADFIAGLHDGNFENSGTTIHDGRNCIKVFDSHGKTLVVKRFKRPNWFNRLVYRYFRRSKANRGFYNAVRLLELGVSTPRPLGFAEVYRRGGFQTGYLVTEFTDYRPYEDLMQGDDHEKKRKFFEQFVRFTADLHKKGVRHDDYNVSNVRYREIRPDVYDFTVIDVNRMKFGRLTKRECLSNIKFLCTDTENTYFLAKLYAKLRGWDEYICLAELALKRKFFIIRYNRKKRIKNWAKHLAKA